MEYAREAAISSVLIRTPPPQRKAKRLLFQGPAARSVDTYDVGADFIELNIRVARNLQRPQLVLVAQHRSPRGIRKVMTWSTAMNAEF